MGPELLVFRRDERAFHPIGNGVGGHEHAPLIRQFGHKLVVTCIQAAHHRRLVGPQPVHRWQVGNNTLVLRPHHHSPTGTAHQQHSSSRTQQHAPLAETGPAQWKRPCVVPIMPGGGIRVTRRRSACHTGPLSFPYPVVSSPSTFSLQSWRNSDLCSSPYPPGPYA